MKIKTEASHENQSGYRIYPEKTPIGSTLKKVKLGQTVGRTKWIMDGRYWWAKLRRSLEEGYNPEKYGYIQVLQKEDPHTKKDSYYVSYNFRKKNIVVP